jgi:hypothetical protein
MEYLARFAALRGWRLALLAADGPAGDDATLRAAVLDIVGRWRKGDTTESVRARQHAALGTAWRALMAQLGPRYRDELAACAKRVDRAVWPYRWSPPPQLRPHDDPPFELVFGDHVLTMQDRTVTLDAASQTFDGSDAAALAFEANARAFERAGLRGEAVGASAGLLGTLAPILEIDDRNQLVFAHDELVEATIYDADGVSFWDCAVHDARRSGGPLGAFSADDAFVPGTIGIHHLRRLFAHPAASGAYALTLEIYDSMVPAIVDWLAARPEAARVAAIDIAVPLSDPIGSPPRPIGALFPNLRRLQSAFVAWPLWSAAPFPNLASLTLTDAPAGFALPALGELAPRLSHLVIK